MQFSSTPEQAYSPFHSHKELLQIATYQTI